MFSIVIPTWNNLAYLKLCVYSIQKYSKYKHQILIHVNDGSDGTLEWVKQAQLTFNHSNENIGICKAVNPLAAQANTDYIVYMNDDMFVCPNWDQYILEEIEALNTKNFLLSATMIEPRDTGNPCVFVKDYGQSIETFQEEKLLAELDHNFHADWSGSAWPPTIVHKDYWHLVGGYSIEFSPGMSSDDDFAMKMWTAGCRIFKGIGKSKVYHFQAKSTGRIIKNNGRKQFLMKWGMNQSTFNRYFLKRGLPYQGVSEMPAQQTIKKELFRAWLKRKFY